MDRKISPYEFLIKVSYLVSCFTPRREGKISDFARIGGGLLPWGGLDPLPDPSNPPYLTPNASLPTLTAQRLDIFSFSHMRRLHLHNATSSTPIHPPSHVFPSLPQADGSASSAEAREAIDLTDSQLRSETGLPLAEMFARYFGGSLSYETVRGHGSDAFLMIPRDLMKNFD